MLNDLNILIPASTYTAGLTTMQIAVIVAIRIVCMVTFAWTGLIVLMGAVRLVRRAPAPARPAWLRWSRRTTLAAAMLILLCFAYSFLEPYRLEVTHTRIPCAKLPAGSAGIRIVHISDIHSTGITRLEDDLPAIIAAQEPDIICFTGDALGNAAGLETFRTLINELAEIAPVYAVRGNWEGKPRFAKLNPFAETNMTDISGRAVEVTVNGQDLWLVGLPYGYDRPGPVLSRADASEPIIFLNHIPSIILELEGKDVDLCLTGHTHGGQVALPGYGAIITLTKTGKQFERGLYDHNGTPLYVSRGVGMEGSFIPIRFFSRPEVAVIDLLPAE